MTKQIKSRQRVADHGEVFTAEREVNAMLDLVRQETEHVDSRFLELACGWIKKNPDLPAHGVGKLWKFKRSELDAWIASGKNAME